MWVFHKSINFYNVQILHMYNCQISVVDLSLLCMKSIFILYNIYFTLETFLFLRMYNLDHFCYKRQYQESIVQNGSLSGNACSGTCCLLALNSYICIQHNCMFYCFDVLNTHKHEPLND